MINYTQLVQDVIDGNEDPLRAYGVLKSLEKDVKKCLSEIEGAVFDECEKYSEKNFKKGDFEFEKRKGGKIFSYKNIPSWNKKKEELLVIETIARQAYSSYENGLQVATEDGEEIILPEVTYKKDSLIVKSIK